MHGRGIAEASNLSVQSINITIYGTRMTNIHFDDSLHPDNHTIGRLFSAICLAIGMNADSRIGYVAV